MAFVSLLLGALLPLALCSPLTPALENPVGGQEGISTPQKFGIPTEVGFSAYRQERFDRSKDMHKAVKFEEVEYNEGGHFDPQTGFYSAPYSGLYVFNFASYRSAGRGLRLMKNNYEVDVLSDDGKGKAKNGNGRNILLQLDEQDSVWLRLAHGKHLSTDVNATSTLTKFSGYLRWKTPEALDSDFDLPAVNRRRKRSAERVNEERALERIIRDVGSPPVTLVEAHLDDDTLFGNIKPSGEVTIDVGSPANQKIAFSVTCTKSMIGGHMADTRSSLKGDMNPEPSPNGRLAFDKTLVNIGDGFDIDAGEFVAPTSGAYFFTFNVGKFPRKKLSVMLMKNVNEVQSIIYNDSKTKAREIQGQSLMLQLRKNDRVWLRSFNNEEYAVYSNLGNYITFSGYLVYAV